MILNAKSLPVAVYEASLHNISKNICFCLYWPHCMFIIGYPCNWTHIAWYWYEKAEWIYLFLPRANSILAGFSGAKFIPQVSRMRSLVSRWSRAVCTNTTIEAWHEDLFYPDFSSMKLTQLFWQSSGLMINVASKSISLNTRLSGGCLLSRFARRGLTSAGKQFTKIWNSNYPIIIIQIKFYKIMP